MEFINFKGKLYPEYQSKGNAAQWILPGIAKGLYLFHLYRWGSKDPYNDIKHLF